MAISLSDHHEDAVKAPPEALELHPKPSETQFLHLDPEAVDRSASDSDQTFL